LFRREGYGLLTGHPVETVSLWPDIKDELQPEAASKRRIYFTICRLMHWRRHGHASSMLLSPLHDTGHLGAMLLQYPPWFVPKRGQPRRACTPARTPWRRTCLCRAQVNRLGSRTRTGRALSGCYVHSGLALVVVDAPKSSGLPTVLDATVNDLAVVRFHGRADSTWRARNVTAAERFRYLYSETELAEWVPRTRRLAQLASRVHLLMNNCYQDYGVRNAAQLAAMLAGESDE